MIMKILSFMMQTHEKYILYTKCMHLALCNSFIQHNHSYGNAFIHNVNGNIYIHVYT